MESIIQSFLHELIITNYLFFLFLSLLLLVLFYVFYKYIKIWPRIIVVKIFDYNKESIGTLIPENYKVRYYINGVKNEMRGNPVRIKKWYGIADKCGVSVKIGTNKDTPIFKSEIKRMNRMNYFDFYLSEEESKALGKDGGK